MRAIGVMTESFITDYRLWWRRNFGLAAEIDRFRPSLGLAHQIGVGARSLAPLLVDYINRFDDSDGGGWLLFDIGRIDWVLSAESGSLAVGIPKPVLPEPDDPQDPRPKEELIRWLSRVGSCVFLGSENVWLTRQLPWVFRVLITGSRDRRIDEVMQQTSSNRDAAAAAVDASDAAASAFADRYFGARADDPTQFHLVVNSDAISESMLVSLIGDSLLEWGARHPQPRAAWSSIRTQEMRGQSQDLKSIP